MQKSSNRPISKFPKPGGEYSVPFSLQVRTLLPELGRSVLDSANAFLSGAECAAKNDSMFVFRTVPQNSAATMVACWRERMDSALEAVEDVRATAESDLKGLVVSVAANFTGFHDVLREVNGEGKTRLRCLRSRDLVSELSPSPFSAAPRTLRVVPTYVSAPTQGSIRSIPLL
jgi:hypothetical protein